MNGPGFPRRERATRDMQAAVDSSDRFAIADALLDQEQASPAGWTTSFPTRDNRSRYSLDMRMVLECSIWLWCRGASGAWSVTAMRIAAKTAWCYLQPLASVLPCELGGSSTSS